MKKESQVIFDRNVVEFVTVAAEFCKFLEQTETIKRSTFVDTSLKILPLLYLKASMLPKCETIGNEALETFVTEETYEILRMNLADLLAEKDDYLDVFVSDMKYSDQPITRNISEDLADIYQDIRDFIFVFQLAPEAASFFNISASRTRTPTEGTPPSTVKSTTLSIDSKLSNILRSENGVT